MLGQQPYEPPATDNNPMAETYVSPGTPPRDEAHEGNRKFDLRNRLKRGSRQNNGDAPAADVAPEALAEADAFAEQVEAPSSSRAGPPKDLKTRLGVRDRLATETADEASGLVPKNGRHFTGLVSGVDMHKPFCWVVPDGQPAGTKHYLLYEDLPYGFEVMKGSRVDYDLIQGNKNGKTKCSRIFVHQPGRPAGQTAPDATLASGPEEALQQQPPQGANKKEGKKKGAKKQAPGQAQGQAKKIPLSTDPEEEARRKRRAERFNLSYTPLDE